MPLKVILPTDISSCWECPYLVFYGKRADCADGADDRFEYGCRHKLPHQGLRFTFLVSEVRKHDDLKELMPIPDECPLSPYAR
jgi:hypothetical protein